jgi:hypothetical protein
MSNAIGIFVAAAKILWLVLPPILTVFGLRSWKRNRSGTGFRVALPLALGTVLLSEWVLFIHFMIHSATPYGMYFRTNRGTDELLLLSFLVAIGSVAAPTGRWQLVAASVLILSLWVGVGYAPAHYLSRIEFAKVSVNDQSVAASVYMGQPTDSEAEALALVRLENGEGDYLLDFGSEKTRPTERSEYIRVPGGVWFLRSMQSGAFAEPLPPRQMNQFRLLGLDGRVVTVQF